MILDLFASRCASTKQCHELCTHHGTSRVGAIVFEIIPAIVFEDLEVEQGFIDLYPRWP